MPPSATSPTPRVLFRLVHASDWHLARTPYWAGTMSNPWLDRLTRAGRHTSHDPVVVEAFARWLHVNGGGTTNVFDALVVTGDLATTGSAADLQAAYDLLTRTPATAGGYLDAAGRPTLAFWSPPVDLLPGNHDRYRSALSLYAPGGKRFGRVFSGLPLLRPNAHVLTRQWWGSGPQLPPQNNVELRIFNADFTLRVRDKGKRYFGLPGWLGQGRVLPRILLGHKGTQGLIDATIQERNRITRAGRIPVILWAMHFDPFSTDGLLQLLGSDLLVAATQQAGVSAVLCGHTHESKIKPLGPNAVVVACGTTTAATPVAGASGAVAASAAQNDFQVLEVQMPEGASRPNLRVIWFRFRDAPLPGEFLPLQSVTVPA